MGTWICGLIGETALKITSKKTDSFLTVSVVSAEAIWCKYSCCELRHNQLHVPILALVGQSDPAAHVQLHMHCGISRGSVCSRPCGTGCPVMRPSCSHRLAGAVLAQCCNKSRSFAMAW